MTIAAAIADAQAALALRQPLDTDLTNIAGVATTSYGRALLAAADNAAIAALLLKGNPEFVVPSTGDYATPTRGATAAATPSQNVAYWTFLPLAANGTIDRLGVEITTGTASTDIRLGLWSDDGNGKPGTLLLDTGALATTSTAFVEATISQAVTVPGVWLGACRQSASGAPLRTVSSVIHKAGFKRNSATVVTQFNLAAWSKSSVSGAFSSNPSGLIGDVTPPVIAVRFA